MIKTLTAYLDDFAHLFFPHNCLGCHTDTLQKDALLCTACLLQLPSTGFFSKPGNTVEKIFYGRIKLRAAGSAFYFSKESVLHQVVMQLKYHGNRDAGSYLGKLCAHEIKASGRFDDIDVIIPLPLNKRKEKKRGYNQAMLIAAAIGEVIGKPVLATAVTRNVFTETQTQKDRISRWQNMEGVFDVNDPGVLENKHILLVDDVLTTGATLEACAAKILMVPGTSLSIATVAYTL